MRHAEPAWGQDGKPQMDPALTERGREQAKRAAERIAERGLAELWCSDARRSLQTAEAIAHATGKEPLVVPDLTEMRLPDWSGLSLAEVAKRFRDGRLREPEAWWRGTAGGESFSAFAERVHGALRKLLDERGVRRREDPAHPYYERSRDLGRIVIVGHGGTNAVALSALLGFPALPWEWERFGLNHAAFLRLTSVQLGSGFVFGVRALYDCEHLPKELRSA